MAQVISVYGWVDEVSPANGKDFKLAELKKIVEGYIEIVHLRCGKLMVVDEEGKLKGKPINAKASALANQTIVGRVLVCNENEIK